MSDHELSRYDTNLRTNTNEWCKYQIKIYGSWSFCFCKRCFAYITYILPVEMVCFQSFLLALFHLFTNSCILKRQFTLFRAFTTPFCNLTLQFRTKNFTIFWLIDFIFSMLQKQEREISISFLKKEKWNSRGLPLIWALKSRQKSIACISWAPVSYSKIAKFSRNQNEKA